MLTDGLLTMKQVEKICEQYYDEATYDHAQRVADYVLESGLVPITMWEDCIKLALMHDLIEDTDATEEEILKYGSEEILEAVILLTKKKGYVMAEYVDAIKKNPVAFAVKAADRLHNLNCAIVTDEEFKRKYILETVDWYLDFSVDIRKSVKRLAESLKTPMAELSFLYEPIDSWKQ